MSTLNSNRRPAWYDEDSLEGLRIAFVSTYPPRECGLATFCEDLLKAAVQSDGVGEPMVVAMENSAQRNDYSWPVTMLINDREESEYEAAAEFLNDAPVDVVSIQHEFGIFGGQEIGGLRAFLRRLEKPLVVTLHTVLPQPEPFARTMLRELAERAERLVVLNSFAIGLLQQVYDVEPSKIALIHHGAPAPFAGSRQEAKARLGLSGRRVLSTFGLISRGKGIEHALSALIAIRERHPDVCYLVIGETHPGARHHEKESYREELIHFVRKNGLEESVRFVNRYLTKPEIIAHLAATDVYLTPYLSPYQIVSGTLAYAVAAGKAIVSTPYLYAKFLLNEGRGRLVGFRDGEAIAEAVTRILDNPHLQHELESRTLSYGGQMLWPLVGARYSALFHKAVERRIFAKPAYARSSALWLQT